MRSKCNRCKYYQYSRILEKHYCEGVRPTKQIPNMEGYAGCRKDYYKKKIK